MVFQITKKTLLRSMMQKARHSRAAASAPAALAGNASQSVAPAQDASRCVIAAKAPPVVPGSARGVAQLFRKCRAQSRAQKQAALPKQEAWESPASAAAPANPASFVLSGATMQGPIPVRIIQENVSRAPAGKDDISESPKHRHVGLNSVLPIKASANNADEERIEELASINMSYPLTPANPRQGEKVYAWCSVKFDHDEGALVYSVVEPPLTEIDKKEIARIKEIIEEKIDIRFEAIESGSSMAYLRSAIDGIIKQFGISLTQDQRANYEYYILRDFIGLGKLQPLLNDQNIEDISCDGADIPIFVYHRDPKLASLRTNVVFETRDALNDFVMKVAQRCSKSVSVAEPILEGALPDGSRVQAILETDIARRGSNVTIRKFSKEPITPVHLLNFGTSDSHLLAYLWYLVEHRRSILVSGPTASGKTSLLNALSLFIHPSMKVVSIEDTPELRLPHAHWVPEIAREGFGIGEHKIGEVTLFDLLKGALRQRPDYIIVGEVRGQEAYILFQAMATGHSGLATIHADSVDKVVDRLTTPPINLPASLIETLDVIVFIKRIRHHEAYVRRLFEVHEVVGYDFSTKQPKTRMVFRWDPLADKFDAVADSEALGALCENEGLSEEDIRSELYSRQKVLDWLKGRGISGYKEVGAVIADYYNNRERVLDTISQNVNS